MLNRAREPARGVTLVELMIGVSLLAFLLMLAGPGFSRWLQNSQIRTAAEALQNGLHLARGEAVRRNQTVRFQLTTTLDNGCSLSATARNWIVSMDDPTSKCASSPDDAVDPRILQVRPAGDGSPNAAVTADVADVAFNGLGRASAARTINITNPSGGTCAAASGPMRCLRIVVTPAGQLRLCDPARPTTDPQSC